MSPNDRAGFWKLKFKGEIILLLCFFFAASGVIQLQWLKIPSLTQIREKCRMSINTSLIDMLIVSALQTGGSSIITAHSVTWSLKGFADLFWEKKVFRIKVYDQEILLFCQSQDLNQQPSTQRHGVLTCRNTHSNNRRRRYGTVAQWLPLLPYTSRTGALNPDSALYVWILHVSLFSLKYAPLWRAAPVCPWCISVVNNLINLDQLISASYWAAHTSVSQTLLKIWKSHTTSWNLIKVY